MFKRCAVYFQELPAVETPSMSTQWSQGRGYDLTKENNLCWYTLLSCSAITNHGHAWSSVDKSVHSTAINNKCGSIVGWGKRKKSTWVISPMQKRPPLHNYTAFAIILLKWDPSLAGCKEKGGPAHTFFHISGNNHSTVFVFQSPKDLRSEGSIWVMLG